MEARITHAEQHYVPEFLLKGWHFGSDKKLVQYKWVPNRLDIQRYTAKAVAKERHLYSTVLASGERDTSIERDYFGPEIDDKAAPILQKIISEDVHSLQSAQRETWARFLIAQMVRVPKKIRHFKAFAEREFSMGATAVASRLGRQGFQDYVKKHAPYAGENAGVEMLETVIESDKLNSAMLKATWSTLQLRWSSYDLLIGDHPLLLVGPLATNFLAVLPLAPRVLFCAASDYKTLEQINRESHTNVVKTINKDSVRQAATYVYAKDTSQTALVEKHLNRPKVS